MFGLERYLIIANTVSTVILTFCLALFIYFVDKNLNTVHQEHKSLVAEISDRFDKIAESQMVIVDTLRVIREDQKVLSAAIATNRTLSKNEIVDLVAKITEMNNSVNTMSTRVKRLPETSCHILTR